MTTRKIRTHYDNLKVSHDAPPEVIRMAYKALVTKYHPDRNPGCDRSLKVTQAINASYEVLMNPEKRRLHDSWIAAQLPKQNPVTPTEAPEQKRRSQPAEPAPSKPPPSPPPPVPPSADHRSSNQGKSILTFLCWIIGSGLLLGVIVSAINDRRTTAGASRYATPYPTYPTPVFTPAPVAKATPDFVEIEIEPPTDLQPIPELTPNLADEPKPEFLQLRQLAIAAAEQSPRPAVTKPPAKLIYWDTKQYPVKVEKAAAIQKKVDLAWTQVRDLYALKEQRKKLVESINRAFLGKQGKEAVKKKIVEVDATMRNLNASGKRLIAEIEGDLKAASPDFP